MKHALDELDRAIEIAEHLQEWGPEGKTEIERELQQAHQDVLLLRKTFAQVDIGALDWHIAKERVRATAHYEQHRHNDVGTLTEQLNRARDALQSVAIHRQKADVPISADSDEADWRLLARRMEDIARKALRALEAPSE